MKTQHLVFIFILLSLGSSKTLTVDSSISSPSGTSYPTLSSAVDALYSGNTLIETTNTITLLSNTVGTTQTITRTLYGNSGTGSIVIQFESPPDKVNSPVVCSQLPILSLTGTSFLYSNSGMTAFTLIGLNIVARYTDSLSHELNYIGTVTFSKFCLDLTNPGVAVPYYDWVYMERGTQVTITNGYISYDGTMTLWVQHTSFVNMSDLVLYNDVLSQDTSRSAIQVYQSSAVYDTIFNITNVQVTCAPTAMPMPYAIYSNRLTSIYYTNFQVTNCDFSKSSTLKKSLFYTGTTVNTLYDNITFTNVVMGNSYWQGLLKLSGNYNSTISNIQFKSVTASLVSTNNELMLIDGSDYYYSSGINVTISNVSIVDSSFVQNFYCLFVNLTHPDRLQGYYVNNFTIDGGYAYSSTLINFIINPATTDTTQIAPKTFTISNFNILNFQFESSTLIDLQYSTSLVPAVEIFHFEFSNIFIANNVMSNVWVFNVAAVHLQFVNLIAVNNTLTDSTALIETRYYMDSLFVIDSNFTNNTLKSGSRLISYDVWQTVRGNINASETTSYNIDNSFVKNSTTFYTETRPFIIYNTIFTDIRAEDSNVIWSVNPQVIIQGNTMQNITLVNSRLLWLGGYMPYANAYASGKSVTLPLTTTWFDFWQTGENYALYGNWQMSALFYDVRNATCLYSPQHCAKFLYVKDNIVNQVRSTTMPFLIGLQKFQTANSSALITNNILSEIQIAETPIILSDAIDRVFIIGNTATRIKELYVYCFSIKSNILDKVIFDSNSFSSTSVTGGVMLSSPQCNDITIQNISAQDVETDNRYVSINCDFIQTQFTFKDSNFRDIAQKTPMLIYLSTQNSSSAYTGSVLFRNNIFTNITMIKQEEGSIILITPPALLYLFVPKYSITLQNNTMTDISLPDGVAISVAAPTVIMTSSTFNGLSYGDARGALYLITQSFTLSSSTFTDCRCLNSTEPSLIKLASSSSVPVSSVSVTISNCSFANNSELNAAIMHFSTSTIQFLMQDSLLHSNLPSTTTQAPFYFESITGSTITIKNSIFVTNQTSESPNYIFYVASTSQTSLTISNCSYQVAEGNSGSFLYANKNSGLTASFTGFNYTAAISENSEEFSRSQAAILMADSINVAFTNLQVANLTIEQTPLFEMNCDRTNSLNGNTWRLSLSLSSFDSLSLTDGIITINSDEYTLDALDDLAVTITNTNFSGISLTGSSSMITSKTSLIGNSQTDSFSVRVSNCLFSQINSTTGAAAIFSSVESRYRNVLSLDSNTFQDINSTSSSSLGGGLINTSTTLLSQALTSSSNSNTVKVTNNAFSGIQSSEGGIIAWRSEFNQIALLISNNTFTSVSATEDGGIIFANYSASTSSSSTQPVVLNVTKNTFTEIGARNGGIIQFLTVSATNAYNIIFDSNDCKDVNVFQNGGIINLPKISSSNEGRRLLSVTTLPGHVVISNNQINNISAANGAVIYDFTPDLTLNLSLTGNTFDTLSAAERGGLAFLNRPYFSMQNNEGSTFTAGQGGSVIYSMSDNLIFDTSSNQFTSVQYPTVSFYPTNIKIVFINNSDSSLLYLENYTSLSSTPRAPNLTSYSLSLYHINLTLVYAGVYASQLAGDDSSNAIAHLLFISPDPENLPQSYSTSNCLNATCSVNASDIILKGNAGDIYIVNVTYESNAFTLSQQFTISLRECGESELNQSGICTQIPPAPSPDPATPTNPTNETGGTVIVQPNGTYLNCPLGAECKDNEIWIRPGYYKSESAAGIYIMPCNDREERCFGGKTSSCSEGYTGPFCLQCDQSKGFVPDSESYCVNCNDDGVVVGVIVLLIGYAYQLLFIVALYNGNKKNYHESSEKSVTKEGSRPVRAGEVMLICTTFAQISSIIAAANVGPGFLSSFLNIAVGVSNPTKQMFWALKCRYYKLDMDPLDATKMELLLYIFSPLMKLTLAFILEVFRMIFKKCKESRTGALSRMGTVIIALIILEHPSITAALANYLTCEKLDPYMDEKFMKNPTAVQCYTPEYNSFRGIVVIPAFIIWGFCIPLAVFLILRTKKNKLQQSEALNKVMGGLYSSYFQRFYYWSMIIICLKLAIYLLDSLLTLHEISQAVIFFIVIQLYREYVRKAAPYTQKLLVQCENYCGISYRAVLLIVILKESIGGTIFGEVCDIFIIISITIPGLYLLGWTGAVQVKAFNSLVEKDIDFEKDTKKKSAIAMTSMQSQADEMISSPTHRINSITNRYEINIPY